MIHRLEIENLCSVRDRRVIDLGAEASLPDDPYRIASLRIGSRRHGPMEASSVPLRSVKDSVLAPAGA